MRARLLLIAVLFFAALGPVALAAEGGNLTTVSVNQNATISVNKSGDGLYMIGPMGNATVYASGNANVTLMGGSLRLELDSAPEMCYRDVYLFLEVPLAYENVTFDYDLVTGEKSNVLLVDFADVSPRLGVRKGGIVDHAILGLGTWSAMYGQIGGLKAFPQGSHRVEITTHGNQLVVKFDGKSGFVVDSGYRQGKYLVVHLMTGDGDSYLRGTLGGLKYAGPPLTVPVNATGTPTPLPGTVIIPTTMPLVPTPDATVIPWNGGDDDDNGTVTGRATPISGLTIAMALAAGLGFLIAWGIVYFKYMNK